MSGKIYDCFCYLNEDLMLELRLETLWAHVDYFVIVEATYTQSGNPKPLNFTQERFARYQSKIRYLVVDHKPPGEPDAWKNEKYQRNYIAHGLFDAQSDDIILISDLDEIINPQAIAHYQPRYRRANCAQRCYAYFFNNLCFVHDQPATWACAKITTYRHFVKFFNSDATSVRHYKSSGLLRSIKRAVFNRWQTQTIPNAGWHFTWILSIDKIIYKIESMAHQEYNKPEYRTEAYIKKKIFFGQDLFVSSNTYYRAQKIDHQFPEFLVTHQARFQEFLLPAGCD